MTEGEDGWYSIEVPGWVNSIIINANEGGIQTPISPLRRAGTCG